MSAHTIRRCSVFTLAALTCALSLTTAGCGKKAPAKGSGAKHAQTTAQTAAQEKTPTKPKNTSGETTTAQTARQAAAKVAPTAGKKPAAKAPDEATEHVVWAQRDGEDIAALQTRTLANGAEKSAVKTPRLVVADGQHAWGLSWHKRTIPLKPCGKRGTTEMWHMMLTPIDAPGPAKRLRGFAPGFKPGASQLHSEGWRVEGQVGPYVWLDHWSHGSECPVPAGRTTTNHRFVLDVRTGEKLNAKALLDHTESPLVDRLRASAAKVIMAKARKYAEDETNLKKLSQEQLMKTIVLTGLVPKRAEDGSLSMVFVFGGSAYRLLKSTFEDTPGGWSAQIEHRAPLKKLRPFLFTAKKLPAVLRSARKTAGKRAAEEDMPALRLYGISPLRDEAQRTKAARWLKGEQLAGLPQSGAAGVATMHRHDRHNVFRGQLEVVDHPRKLVVADGEDVWGVQIEHDLITLKPCKKETLVDLSRVTMQKLGGGSKRALTDYEKLRRGANVTYEETLSMVSQVGPLVWMKRASFRDECPSLATGDRDVERFVLDLKAGKRVAIKEYALLTDGERAKVLPIVSKAAIAKAREELVEEREAGEKPFEDSHLQKNLAFAFATPIWTRAGELTTAYTFTLKNDGYWTDPRGQREQEEVTVIHKAAPERLTAYAKRPPADVLARWSRGEEDDARGWSPLNAAQLTLAERWADAVLPGIQ